MVRKIKIVTSILLFCVLSAFCSKAFSYVLVDDTTWYSSSRIMMHELYTQESNIDVLFVGSSHCYRSFVPDITDEILKVNTFNAGSSSQDLDGSLALIREAAKNNELKQIYLEMYYGIAMHPDYDKRTEMTSTYLVSDYMKPSINKLGYLLHASSKEYYVDSFIPARRYWQNFFDIGYVKNVIQRKNTKIYRNYKYDYVTTEKEYYAGKGYVASEKFVEPGTYWAEEDFASIQEENISSDWKESLQEIIGFCEKKDIALTLISSPMPDFRLISIGNYDSYIEYVNKMIEGTDVRYYDFNLCKEAYFPGTDELFMDTDHLSKSGAELFSTIFSEFRMGEISEEDLFYSSYEEKIRNSSPRLYGLITSENKQENLVAIKPVENTELKKISYSVTMIPDDQDSFQGKDNILSDEIRYADGEMGTLEVAAYLDGKKTNYISVRYGEE